MAGTLKIAFSRHRIFPHLKESPSRNAVELNPSLDMLLSSLLVLPKATGFVCGRLPSAWAVECVQECTCCAAISAGLVYHDACSQLHLQEQSVSSNLMKYILLPPSASGLISWRHACSCMYVFWSSSKHSDLWRSFTLVRPFYFFKVGSCSCKLCFLNWFFLRQNKINQIIWLIKLIKNQ